MKLSKKSVSAISSVISLAGGMLIASMGPASADVKPSTVTFPVYMRTGPSTSINPPLGVVNAGSPINIYCQTQTTDSSPTSVAGHGTSWLWDLASVNLNGIFTRGYITDLAASNTPYQVRDSSLPDCANIGGIDVNGYCKHVAGKTHAALHAHNVLGWGCDANSWSVFGYIPLDATQMTYACEWRYGTSGDGGYLTIQAFYGSYSDPYSWRCRIKGYNQ